MVIAILIYYLKPALACACVRLVKASHRSAGLSVSSMRFQAILIAGLLTGIAGAYPSTAHGAGFVREMTAGKGHIALAAMIFGKWRPGPPALV